MDPSSAKKVIARFLLPRVKARVNYMRSGCSRGCVVHIDYLYPCHRCYDPVFGGGICKDCRAQEQQRAALDAIVRFLLPRVRAYMEFKRSGSDAGNFAFLSPCSVCYEPSFGGHWCLKCRDAHAADPHLFARDNFLCRHCFFPDGPEGCIDMCEGWRDEMACDAYDRRGADSLCREAKRNGWDRD